MGWPDRPVLHSFPTPGPRGEVQIVQTGGARKPQLQRLMDITTPRAGQQSWQALQDVARKYLTDRKLTLLTHLTQEEAAELIQTLESHPLYTKPNGPTEVRHEQMFDAMLAEVGVTEQKELVLALMERSYGTKDVNAMPTDSFRKALTEMRSLASDPAAFGLMLSQITGQSV